MAVAVNADNIQTVSPIDALWSLIQHQSKTIRRTLAKRLNASIEAEDKPKTKMTEAEYYAKLDKSIEASKSGKAIVMGTEETGEEFINRMLSSQR